MRTSSVVALFLGLMVAGACAQNERSNGSEQQVFSFGGPAQSGLDKLKGSAEWQYLQLRDPGSRAVNGPNLLNVLEASYKEFSAEAVALLQRKIGDPAGYASAAIDLKFDLALETTLPSEMCPMAGLTWKLGESMTKP